MSKPPVGASWVWPPAGRACLTRPVIRGDRRTGSAERRITEARFHSPRDRKLQHEAGASQGTIFDPGTAAVTAHNVVHDSEANAAAGDGPVDVTLESRERMPDARPVAAWNAGTAIVYADQSAVTFEGDPHVDLLPRPAVLRRVLEEVRERAPQRAPARFH